MTKYSCRCCGEIIVNFENAICLSCVFDCHGCICRKVELYDTLKERQLDLNGNKKTIFHLI